MPDEYDQLGDEDRFGHTVTFHSWRKISPTKFIVYGRSDNLGEAPLNLAVDCNYPGPIDLDDHVLSLTEDHFMNTEGERVTYLRSDELMAAAHQFLVRHRTET